MHDDATTHGPEPTSDGSAISRRLLLGGTGAAAVGLGTGLLTLGAGPAAAAPGPMVPSPGREAAAASALQPGLTYVTFGGWHFQPLDSTQTWSGLDANFGFTGGSSGYVSMVPQLPAGAVLKEIEVYGTRGAAGSVRVELWTKRVTDGTLANPASLTVPASAGSFTATLAVDAGTDGTLAAGPFVLIDAAAAPATRLFGMRLGYVSPGALRPLSPITRVYNTRDSALPKLAALEERIVPLGLPAGARNAILNLTVTQTGAGGGYVAVFPADVTWPGNSSINWTAANEDVANLVVTTMDASGRIKIRGGGQPTHVIIDVLGFLV